MKRKIPVEEKTNPKKDANIQAYINFYSYVDLQTNNGQFAGNTPETAF